MIWEILNINLSSLPDHKSSKYLGIKIIHDNDDDNDADDDDDLLKIFCKYVHHQDFVL